jgi:hypothetical protein
MVLMDLLAPKRTHFLRLYGIVCLVDPEILVSRRVGIETPVLLPLIKQPAWKRSLPAVASLLLLLPEVGQMSPPMLSGQIVGAVELDLLPVVARPPA